ncbi:nitroreductase [Comamonas sp. BIGb0124]|uniref:nitroreductase n=1 Tax=Comamonas sp. BIGb0124 TaxID=2485130 RepID=UPI000FB79844|nr:nitroreductase [Comamonas sp. BIGb0124]ROR21077.1 nitroreductase [Comamonas sp. BIGb0124]
MAGLRAHEGLPDWMDARHSTRAYAPREVPLPLLQNLLVQARRAPSGANLQPGHFYAVQGEMRQRLTTALETAWAAGAQESEDYPYFPRPLPLSLRRRQVAAAQALYSALAVAREDRAGRDRQFARNFRFFDAPVAMVITIDRSMGSGCYMDLGMAIYGLMLAAQAQGLATCAIGALASYPELIRRTLALPDSQAVVCGLALGYAQADAPVNRTRTERSPLADFFTVLG